MRWRTGTSSLNNQVVLFLGGEIFMGHVYKRDTYENPFEYTLPNDKFYPDKIEENK